VVKGVRALADQYIALVIGLLIFLASLISVEAGISVALIEITLGVIGGNFLKISHPSFSNAMASG
jgi:hypothetical protein